MRRYETNILLLSVVFCWAAAYVFIETLSGVLSPFGYLAMVNGIAAILLGIIFLPRLLRITPRELLHSVVLGAIMLGVLLAEYAGVKLTNSSTASLLGAMDVVVVPLLLLFLGRVPQKNQLAGIFLILAGTVLSNGLSGSGNHAAGVFFMALDGILMALYNVVSNRFCEKDDPAVLAAVQLCFMALVSLGLWYREDPAVFFGVVWTTELISSVLVLGIFSKAFAYIALMYGERYADPISVVVIFALEPVITMLFAAFFPGAFGGAGEQITRTGLICAGTIVSGSIIAGMDREELREFVREIRGIFRREPVLPAESILMPQKEEGSPADPVRKENGSPTDPVRKENGSLSDPVRKWSRLRSFVSVFLLFFGLGVSFKIMVLIRNYTEIRPVNSIPGPAGLMFGIPGAAACALGNLAADCFGTLQPSSVLGILANFLQALIPYRLWRLYGEGAPNVHSRRNLAVFLFLTAAATLTTVWVVAYGISFFFGGWIPHLSKYVFLNDMVFPVIFGLPAFVILTSPDIALVPRAPLPWILPLSGTSRKRMFAVFLGIMMVFSGMNLLGITPANAGNAPFLAASVPAALLLTAVLL